VSNHAEQYFMADLMLIMSWESLGTEISAADKMFELEWVENIDHARSTQMLTYISTSSQVIAIFKACAGKRFS